MTALIINLSAYLVEQWLDLLLLLPFTDLIRIRNSEELWSNLYQPFRLDGSYVVAIITSGQNQLVEYTPLWIPVE